MPNPDAPPGAVSLMGHGRTATVWRLDGGQVTKVFVADRSHTAVDAETRATEIIGGLRVDGVEVPAFGGLVDVDGRRAMVLGEVAGEEMLAVLGRRPWADRWLPVMAFARIADSPPVERPALSTLARRLAD